MNEAAESYAGAEEMKKRWRVTKANKGSRNHDAVEYLLGRLQMIPFYLSHADDGTAEYDMMIA